MNKRILCLLAMVFIAGLLSAGCGNDDNTPSAATTRFLEALKADELDDVADIYLQEEIDPASLIFGDDVLNDQAEDMFDKKVLGFDYMLGTISEQDSIATVTVDITAYSLGSAISELESNQSFMDSLVNIGSSPFSSEANTVLVNQIGQTKKTYEQTVKLNLTKINDIWTVNEITDDSDFITAISGNTPATLSSMSASYKKTKAESENQQGGTETTSPSESSGHTSQTADYEIDSIDDAIEAVEDYLRIDDDDPDKPQIKVDSEDNSSYTVVCYEVMQNADGTSSNAIIGYFLVDKVTGDVTEKDSVI